VNVTGIISAALYAGDNVQWWYGKGMEKAHAVMNVVKPIIDIKKGNMSISMNPNNNRDTIAN
jgi:hypothetical protein